FASAPRSPGFKDGGWRNVTTSSTSSSNGSKAVGVIGESISCLATSISTTTSFEGDVSSVATGFITLCSTGGRTCENSGAAGKLLVTPGSELAPASCSQATSTSRSES